MKLATLTKLRTLDGIPTKQILLLEEKRLHWLRGHGHGLLSKVTGRRLPQELWHITATVLENDRRQCVYHAVVVRRLVNKEGGIAVTMQETCLPLQPSAADTVEAVELYQRQLGDYRHMSFNYVHHVGTGRPWHMQVIAQETGLYRLYRDCQPEDVVRYLLDGSCRFCHEWRAVSQVRAGMEPWLPQPGLPSILDWNPYVACPNCVGLEASREDVDFYEAWYMRMTTRSDAEARAERLNCKLTELGYSRKSWRDFRWDGPTDN
ncbi:hypothetical protein CALVIDRAFT_536754 [Calocera viscosa TUFC12733]|uniref:Uncharacterized protein n=1 Tax=Calocera viscosa (strain TUFC12733) TaxID=1330018 RepID=A0A167ML84_CALVF|nr:hypothetical protein CALVIDRAFT_536754 [Calocera viscosa TUFC12733]